MPKEGSITHRKLFVFTRKKKKFTTRKKGIRRNRPSLAKSGGFQPLGFLPEKLARTAAFGRRTGAMPANVVEASELLVGCAHTKAEAPHLVPL